MSAPGFTGAGLDRADHLRLDAERMAEHDGQWRRAAASARRARSGARRGGRLAWAPLAGWKASICSSGSKTDAPLFAPLVRTGRARPARLERVPAARADERQGRGDLGRGAERSTNGTTGIVSAASAALRPAIFRAGWGRKCPDCGAEHFPRVDPVVIMLAEHEGRVLLARQPQYPPGRYSALAGFVEPGESIEEAVARELMEEAGVAVSDVRYVASQPWPFPGSLMIACIAKAETRRDQARHQRAGGRVSGRPRAEVEAALAGDPRARRSWRRRLLPLPIRC